MPVLNEGTHTAEHLVSEANGHRSREEITVISGQNLAAAAVVAKITASGKYTELNPAGADGSEVAAGVLYAAVDASAADKQGVVHLRDSEVVSAALVWPAGITGPEQATAIAELAAIGVIAR